MSRGRSGVTRLLPAVLCLLVAGCVQQSVRPVATNQIEPGDEGRQTIIDIKMEKYERLAKDFPEEPRYKERLARLAWMQKDHNAALSYLDQAIKLDPDNPKYMYLKGTIYYGVGNYRLAESSFRTLLDDEQASQYTGPYLQLAEICLVQERQKEAFDHLVRCTEIDPNFSSPYYYMGQIHLRNRDKEEAITAFEEYLKLGGGVYQEEVLQLLEKLQRKVRIHRIK